MSSGPALAKSTFLSQNMDKNKNKKMYMILSQSGFCNQAHENIKINFLMTRLLRFFFAFAHYNTTMNDIAHISFYLIFIISSTTITSIP